MSLEAAALVGDMVTTGFHGVELANVKYGDRVAVIGIGPVGLMSVAGAALRGAAEIFAVGSRPVTRRLAKEFGADDTVDYHDAPFTQQLMELTGGKQFDCVIIAGGEPTVFNDALSICKYNGTVANLAGHGRTQDAAPHLHQRIPDLLRAQDRHRRPLPRRTPPAGAAHGHLQERKAPAREADNPGIPRLRRN